jgi:rod shape-determining protein MreC
MLDFFGNFARYGTFFTFLLLEIICFSLVVRYNKSQQEILLHSGNLFSGKVLQAYNSGRNYLHLADVADSLALQNAVLIKRANTENDPPILVFKDTIDVTIDTLETSRFEIIPAKVINNSINKFHNFLTLDQGENSGLEPGMGVVTPFGLVGIVRNVSKHYARVMSVLHRQNRVSVAVKRNDFFGTLVWKGLDPLKAVVEDIPKHANLQVGDTLVTSGFSSIFPRGLPVGVITDFELASGSNSYSVEVQLGQDLSNINYCYVVKNIRKEELEAIEQSVENE